MTILTPHHQFTIQLLGQLAAGTLFGPSSSSSIGSATTTAAEVSDGSGNRLSLRNQRIKDSGLEQLLGTLCSPAPQPAIKTNRITGLDLAGNDLTRASMLLLVQSGLFLGPGAPLRTLNLAANQLDDSAVQLLASAITAQSSGYCSLHSINLDSNPGISDACVACLLELAVSPAASSIRSVSLEKTLVSQANLSLIDEAFRTKQRVSHTTTQFQPQPASGCVAPGFNTCTPSGPPAPVITSPPPPFNPDFISASLPQSHPEPEPKPEPEPASASQPSPSPAPAPALSELPAPSPAPSPAPPQQQSPAPTRNDPYDPAAVGRIDISQLAGSGHPAVPHSVNWEQIHRSEAEKKALHMNIRTSRARAILLQQDNPPVSAPNSGTTVMGFSETESDSELAHILMLEEYQRLEDRSVRARLGSLFKILPSIWNQPSASSSSSSSSSSTTSKSGGLSRPYGGSVQSPSITSNAQLPSYFSDNGAYKELKPVQFFEGAMCIPPNAQLQTWIHDYVLYGVVLSFYIFPISQFSGQKGSSACSLISLENIRLILEATRSSNPPPLEYHFTRAIQTGNQMYRAIGLNYSERDMACNVSMLMANEGIFETLSLIPPCNGGDPYISVPNPDFGLETFQRLLDRILDDVNHYLKSHPERQFTTGVFVSSSSDTMIGSTISAVFLRNQDGTGLGDVLVFDSHAVFAHEYSVVWRIPHAQPQFVEEPVKSFLLSYLGDLSIVEFFHLGIADDAPIPTCTTPTPK